MKPLNFRAIPHYTWSHRWVLLSAVITVVGLFLGGYWFFRNLTLSPYGRGLMCCDAARYLWLSTAPIDQVVSYAADRSFGYPFFLALFRQLSPTFGQEFFLRSAFATQFACSLLSSTILYWGIRSTGLKVPVVCYALLLAHPALAGIAAVPLADSLAASFAVMFIGIVALICHSQNLLWLKCLALGLLASLILSVRPSNLPFLFMWSATFPIIACWGTFARRREYLATLKTFTVSVGAFIIGLLPVGGHLVNNCYTAYKQICLIAPVSATGNMAGSLEMNYHYSRTWGTVDPAKSWQWRYTADQILENCTISYSTPLDSIKKCYQANLTKLPHHFLHRAIGLFDYRHLNPYAALETSNSDFWALRSFAAISIIGVIACAALMLLHLFRGTLYEHGYLLLPLSYFGVQITLHTENRYLLPILPCFFILGTASLLGNPFKNKWVHMTCLCLAGLIVAYSLHLVLVWDESALQLIGSR